MDTLNIRWVSGVAFWFTIFLPKQLSLIGMQKYLFFEKLGIASRLQIVHFVYKTRISLTNRAFQITNLRFNYKSRISFYKCDFSDYNSADADRYCIFLHSKLRENNVLFAKILKTLVKAKSLCYNNIRKLHYWM